MMQVFELDELADAITAVADARHRIPLDRLLRETALNILILTRIATNRIDDSDQRDETDAACDRLADLLRQAARSLPDAALTLRDLTSAALAPSSTCRSTVSKAYLS